MYKSIAKYYDLLGWGEFHDAAYTRLKPLLEKHRAKSYLDMACGTGSLCCSVARMGIVSVGIDKSKDMLSMAEQRLRHFRGRNSPLFLRRDITRFNLHRRFDAVGCFFDAVNHILTEEGFFNMIKCTAVHLRPGGFFIFDVNTALGLKRWDAVLFTEKGKHAVFMKGKYDPPSRLAEITIVGFVEFSQGNRDRFRETFYERAYTHKFIIDCLRKNGFSKIEGTPGKQDQTLRTALRVFYTAYKT